MTNTSPTEPLSFKSQLVQDMEELTAQGIKMGILEAKHKIALFILSRDTIKPTEYMSNPELAAYILQMEIE